MSDDAEFLDAVLASRGKSMEIEIRVSLGDETDGIKLHEMLRLPTLDPECPWNERNSAEFILLQTKWRLKELTERFLNYLGHVESLLPDRSEEDKANLTDNPDGARYSQAYWDSIVGEEDTPQ